MFACCVNLIEELVSWLHVLLLANIQHNLFDLILLSIMMGYGNEDSDHMME